MSLAVLGYLWESLQSTVVLTWYVLLISMSFGWVGFVVLSWLKTGIKAEVFGSTSIVTGLGISLAIGWYLFRIGIPLQVCIVFFFFLGISFVSVRLLKYVIRNDGVEIRSVCTDFLSSALFRLLMITLFISAFRVLLFHSSQISIGALGNADFYSWSAMADTLIGRYAIDNIYGAVPLFQSPVLRVAFGTSLTLAVVALGTCKLAMESTPFYMTAVLAWSALVVTELVGEIFALNGRRATLIALLVVCGAFFTHIALHSFYGQLLGTFGFLSILRASLYLASEKSPVTLLRRVAFVFPMVLATFITYPLGFVVFFSVSCYSAMVFGLGLWWHRGVFAAFKTTLLRLVVPLLGSLVGLFLLLPEIAIHWYHWTVFVAQTLAGWPLPGLLSPYILFSIPIKLRMKGLYAKPEVYIIAIGILFVMTLFAYRRLRYKDSKCSRLIISSVFIYITFVVVYTIAHIINGSTYQVWKFASFSIMPMSFVVLGIVAICIDELFCIIRERRDWVTPFHINLITCIIVIACIFGLYRSGLTQGNWGGKVERINDKIERLKDLKTDLGGTKKVVVDLGPYSMMAFNVLSKDFHLLPTVLTYYPPAPLTDSELQPGDTRWLTFSDCMEVMESTPRELLQRRSFPPLESDFVIMEPGMVVGAYRFWLGDGGCMLCRELKTTGLDGISSWGRSSDGNRVTIGYDVPPVLKGQAIRFTFRVVPYVSGNVMAQNIIVSVGGIYYRTFEMRGLGFLRVDVPAEETLASQVVIQFDLPNAFCAENDGALSLDGRILGVKFVDLAIERIAHD